MVQNLRVSGAFLGFSALCLPPEKQLQRKKKNNNNFCRKKQEVAGGEDSALWFAFREGANGAGGVG